MAWYLVCVELHGGEGKDSAEFYSQLDKVMERAGFKKTVHGSANLDMLKLPRGLYDYETEDELSKVHTDAKATAKTVWRKPSIVVVRYNDMRLSGLEPLDKTTQADPAQS